MLAMPSDVSILYFPLVLPQKKLISFVAQRDGDTITITSDPIKMLKEGGENIEAGNKKSVTSNP